MNRKDNYISCFSILAGKLIKLIRDICKTKKKTKANIILNDEKTKAFLLRSGTRQECPSLYDIVLEILASTI
jgi:hypothetical protein